MKDDAKKVKRAALYGTYTLKPSKSGNLLSSVKFFFQLCYLIIVMVTKIREYGIARDYCLEHGYDISIARIDVENKAEHSPQAESREWRYLIHSIEEDKIDIVLFSDFKWIREKPERIERLLKIAEAHNTMLIDVRKRQRIV